MTRSMRNLFWFIIPTLISLGLLVTTTSAFCLSWSWRMAIINEEPSTIWVKVKSADNDLGGHYLSKGQSFKWNFCSNVVGETLFYAYFKWGKKYASFNVFDTDIGDKCWQDAPLLDKGACRWYVNRWGFYLTGGNNYTGLDWQHKWYPE